MPETTLSPQQQKYLETTIAQQKWFSAKSQRNQDRGNALGVIMLVTSTLTGGLALVNVEGAMKALGIATGIIGGINTVAIGFDRQHRFKEIGNHYRIASEEIKAHIRLFEAGLLPFEQFATKVEATIQKDLNRFKEDTEDLGEKKES